MANTEVRTQADIQNLPLRRSDDWAGVFSRISWGSVLAGSITGLIVQVWLSMLGVAVGASAIDPLQEANPAAGLDVAERPSRFSLINVVDPNGLAGKGNFADALAAVIVKVENKTNLAQVVLLVIGEDLAVAGDHVSRFVIVIDPAIGAPHGMGAGVSEVDVFLRTHLRVARDVSNVVVVEEVGLVDARV